MSPKDILRCLKRYLAREVYKALTRKDVAEAFTDDALVNDFSREFWGPEHIRAFVTKELAGDHVTMEPVEAVDNAGMWCVRCRYEGDYDKTGLPDPLIMTNYIRVRDGKIVTLFIINNTPPRY